MRLWYHIFADNVSHPAAGEVTVPSEWYNDTTVYWIVIASIIIVIVAISSVVFCYCCRTKCNKRLIFARYFLNLYFMWQFTFVRYLHPHASRNISGHCEEKEIGTLINQSCKLCVMILGAESWTILVCVIGRLVTRIKCRNLWQDWCTLKC